MPDVVAGHTRKSILELFTKNSVHTIDTAFFCSSVNV